MIIKNSIKVYEKVSKGSRCTWCRMKLMERLGLYMNENLKHALKSHDFGTRVTAAINASNPANKSKRKRFVFVFCLLNINFVRETF